MTSTLKRRYVTPSTLIVAGLLTAAMATTGVKAASYTMRTVEGQVIAIQQQTSESALDMILARLRVEGAQEPLELLLAPQAVCDQLGFELEAGDSIRARVFIGSDGPARVQKIQNLSRGTMVRLRTLHETPLWTSTGSWQGGPMRSATGPHRHGQDRGGRPPR